MSTVASYVAGGTSLLGDIFNLFGQSKANREAEQFQTNVMDQQRQWALQDTAAANLYNSPAQQMQRLQAAKLNPNLIYGEGIQAAGSYDTPRSVPSASYTPQNTLASFSNLGQQAAQALSVGPDIQKTVQETSNLGASYNQINAETALTKAKTVEQGLANTILGTDARSDPSLNGIFQNLSAQNLSSQGEILNNQRQASKLLADKASQEIVNLTDQNSRDWMKNKREQAYNAQTIAESIQRTYNMLKAVPGINQDNLNKAADYLRINSQTQLNNIEAQKKNGEIGAGQFNDIKQSLVDLLIILATKK